VHSQTNPVLTRTTLSDFLGAHGRADAARGARIPVVRTLPADLHTPVSIYLRLRGRSSHTFLFESVEGGERLARYSFVGADPRAVVRSWDDRIEIERLRGPRAGTTEERTGDVRDALRELQRRAPLVETPGLPRFLGGAVGFFAYDSVRLQEAIPRTNPDPLGTPDVDLAIHDTIVAIDHLRSLVHLVTIGEVEVGSADPAAVFAAASAELDALEATLARPCPPPPRGGAGVAPEWTADFDRPAFVDAVVRAKEHILAGDIFQVVLSRRLSADIVCDPFSVYRALRILNPSPYLFFVELGEHVLAGASPEFLVRVQGDVVETLPIAGTRKRGRTQAEDEALEAELRADPKERAEHQMLVDLGRNDIGRVARFGTVEVVDHAIVQRFSHVMHLVSRVRGTMREDAGALDALFATLPAGTLSGAPKVRAMEIIEDFEPTARGIYGGAIGYLDYRGDLDVCIAIRTAVFHAGRVHVQAGAGIVFDSVPDLEFDETTNKARALIEAVALAETGALD